MRIYTQGMRPHRGDYRIDDNDRVMRGDLWIASVCAAWGRKWRAGTTDGRWIGDAFDSRLEAFMACVRDDEQEAQR